MSKEQADKLKLKPLAFIRSYALPPWKLSILVSAWYLSQERQYMQETVEYTAINNCQVEGCYRPAVYPLYKIFPSGQKAWLYVVSVTSK